MRAAFGPFLFKSDNDDTVLGARFGPNFFPKSDVFGAPETCFLGVLEHVWGGWSDWELALMFYNACTPP